MSEVMLVSPETVVTVPANPIWMIAQAVTILRDARIGNAAPTASFTCRKITLPARIHATMTDSERRRHIPHIAFQRRSAGAVRKIRGVRRCGPHRGFCGAPPFWPEFRRAGA
jgi:hypothetical protein